MGTIKTAISDNYEFTVAGNVSLNATGDVSINGAKINYDISPGDTSAEIAAALAAAVTAGRVCIAAPGTYELDAPFDMPAEAKLSCVNGIMRIEPQWLPDVADDDSADNYVIGIRGSLTATTTTLSETYGCDIFTITVASTTGITAGSWLYLSGSNAAGDDALMSDGGDVRVREWVQVASVTDATTLVLASPFKQHHAVGKTITLGVPIANVSLNNIFISASGGTIAVGVSVQHARNVSIENLSIEGLSRAGVDMLACRDYSIANMYSYGEVNSWILQDGCINGRILRPHGNPEGVRFHANGIPRGQVTHRNRCKWVETIDPFFVRGCIGYRAWGGHFLSLRGGRATDMVAVEAISRDTELGGSSNVGLGWDGGPGPLDIAEFGFGCTISDFSITNCKAPGVHTTNPTYAVYFHDHFRMQITNLTIANRGKAADPAISHYANGMDLRDCTGQITNLLISGVYDGITSRNVYGRMKCFNVLIEAGPGVGGIAQFAIVVGCGGGEACEPTFTGLDINGFSSDAFLVGFDIGISADWQLIWRDLNLDGIRASFVLLAKNDTGVAFTSGQIAQFDDSVSAVSGINSRRIKTPTAGARDVCVVIAEYSTYCLVAPFPQVLVSAVVDGAVPIGGLVAATASRQLTSTAVDADACGRALRKATGAAVLWIGGK